MTQSHTSTNTSAGTSPRVLVVEDNPLNAKLLRDLLTYEGYEVLEAATGEDGVQMAQQAIPELVLMDIQLPGIDGREALRQIRALDATRDIPVVAVTASILPEENRGIMEAGFDGFLSKPISLVEMLAEVRKFVADRH